MIPLTKHAEVTDLAALLIIQLERHGYHATFTEARDIAAQILTAQYEHPIARLLSARLACLDAGIDSSSVWFYGDKTPEAEAIIREWGVEHALLPIKICDGFGFEHPRTFEVIVTWYPSYEDAKEKAETKRTDIDREQCWRPQDQAVQP
jgi:hypothetical protein